MKRPVKIHSSDDYHHVPKHEFYTSGKNLAWQYIWMQHVHTCKSHIPARNTGCQIRKYQNLWSALHAAFKGSESCGCDSP